MRGSRRQRQDAAGASTRGASRYRSTPLVQLLARLAWQRDPELWTVRCRDGRGRRASPRISLLPAGITITPTAPGPWHLTMLESGRLRGALRDALFTLDRLGGAEPIGRRTEATRELPGGQGSRPELALSTGCPTPRRREAGAAAPEVLPTAA